MLKRRSEQGDTLIEVLFAITVFSLIVVTSLMLMNQGISASQRSLEITLARQQIDAQAEALRFMHASYVQSYYSGIEFTTTDPTTSPSEEFYKVKEQVIAAELTSASALGSTACGTPPTGSFVLNSTKGLALTTPAFRAPATYPQVVYASDGVVTRSEGIWIEGIRSGDSVDVAARNTGYIDFHIRACWSAPGMKQPMNIGTIVRLYEPRG